MPDTVLESPQTPTPVETPSTPQSPQDINRQALYEQYYGTNGGNPPPAEAAAPVTEPAAQAVVDAEPVAPPVTTLPPEVIQLMQSMQAELQAVKQQLVAQAPAPTTPVAETESSWVTLLREGKIKEFEAALAAEIQKRTQDTLIQQSTAQTREVMRAEAEIDRFTTDLRTANPELVPMEKMIASGAQERMHLARQQGLIKTTDDAIRIYKQSVTEEVNSARKLYHTLRGDGKQEAQVRQREVLSSRPIPPQQVDTSRPQVNGQDAVEPPTESTADYLAKRRANEAKRNGLAL